VLSPDAVAPVVVLGESAAEQVREVVADLQAELVEQAREAVPEFYQRDTEPALPNLEWMRDWRPDRGN
jgi:hypothetical protein